MRVFTKKILISFLALFAGMSVVACNKEETTTVATTPNESLIPKLSNPEEVFVSTADYDITYSDLYEELKKNDGLNQLLTMVDLDLLSSYVSLITNQQIEDKINILQYASDDPDEIATYTAEEKADLEKAFEDSIYLLGYSDDPEEYVKTQIAKELYIEDLLTDVANMDEDWYLNPNTLMTYYSRNYFEDIQLIKVRFSSEAEAKSILRSLNLVSKNGHLLLYTGTTELDKVPSSALNETNTRSLTDNELLNKFLTMYDLVYGGYEDVLDVNSTYQEVLTSDLFTVDYDGLVNVNTNFPTFVYQTLGTYQNYANDVDDTLFYTYEPVKYAANEVNFYYMVLNLDRTDKVDVTSFDGDAAALVALIGQSIYDEIFDTLLESTIINSSFVANRMNELRAENDFMVYDYFLGVDYIQRYTDFVQSETGDASIVASYGDKQITADQLLAYALDLNAPLYAIYSAQTKAVLAAHFTDVYCDEGSKCFSDIELNLSTAKTSNLAELAEAKTQFEESYYSTYYTYEEYIYLAYGVKSETELLLKYYVTSTLQPFFIYDQIMSDNYDVLNDLLALTQPYYDNFFSLNVEHVLIYVDRDENGAPDDYQEFYDGLQDQVAYELKLENFEDAIQTYLEDSDHTFATLLTTYKKAKFDDVTWGEFRSFGFYLKNEVLGDLTYKDTVGAYEQSFVDELVKMYEDYQSPLTSGDDFIYSDGFIETSFGVHIIKAVNNNDFEQPSGQFTMTYDTAGDPAYSTDLVNLNDPLTKAQLKVYADYRFSVIVYGHGDLEAIYGLVRPDIPTSVMAAFEQYFSSLYDALYVVGYMNVIIADQFLNGTYENSISTYCDFTEAEFNTKLNNIMDIYMHQILSDYDQTE